MASVFRLVFAVLFGLAALPAVAADKPTLTVYTYDAFAADYGPGPKLKEGFEKTCGCTLDFVAASSSIGALRKAQLEGKTTKADIILGLDTSLAAEAKSTGLFAPHQLDLSGLTLPTDWHDPDFVPFDYGYFAFEYDTTKVADPPHSFKELIAKPGDFKIVIEDPRSSTTGLGLVLWIRAAYGDKAPEIWKGLKPHVLTVTQDWSEAYDLFLKGEADMVLTYTTSPAYHLIAENNPDYAAAKFARGNYAQIEIAGLLASSPHKKLARQFLEYLVSKDAQKVIPTTNWMYPVRELGADMPKGFSRMITPDPVLLLGDKTVAQKRAAWVDEAVSALGR